MNLRTLVVSCCLLLSAGVLSADESEEADIKHSVRIQILLVESPGVLPEESRRQLSGPTGEVLSALSQLQQEKKATIVNHIDMSVLEECDSMLQIGENVPIRTGSTRMGNGQRQTSYQDVSIGTIVQLKTKVADESVLVELDFSQSTVKSYQDQDEAPQGTLQLTHQTTIQVKDGNAMAVGGMMQKSDDQSKGILFIVAADILDASTVQVMKFQSVTRPPSRSARILSPRARVSSSARPSLEDARNRMSSIAETMFDRADADKDGKLSQDEIAKIGPRDLKFNPPVTKEQYVKALISRMESGQRGAFSRGSRASGFRRPTNSPRAEREANDSDESADTEPEE